jgi:hypothetical protein
MFVRPIVASSCSDTPVNPCSSVSWISRALLESRFQLCLQHPLPRAALLVDQLRPRPLVELGVSGQQRELGFSSRIADDKQKGRRDRERDDARRVFGVGPVLERRTLENKGHDGDGKQDRKDPRPRAAVPR